MYLLHLFILLVPYPGMIHQQLEYHDIQYSVIVLLGIYISDIIDKPIEITICRLIFYCK